MLSTLTILSLDQGKIYKALSSNQFDDRTTAEIHGIQRGEWPGEDQGYGQAGSPRPTAGFAHFLGWLVLITALR
jgi:hypothetical protein